MTETSFTDLLAGLSRTADGALQTVIPPGWMQGRTTYGGLTAALCHEAAVSIAEGMPLRAVQVVFVGPSGGEVKMTPSLMRRGKNTAFVSVDLTGPQGLAARALFTFGKHRESDYQISDMPMPNGLPGPERTSPMFSGERSGPHFTQHFDMLLAEGQPPMSQATKSIIGLWLRHRDRTGPVSPTSILALADAPPPAIMSMFTAPAPISSMTWMAEFLTEDLSTQDGWYFARHIAQTASDGYSSQSMSLWSRDGRPILVERQTIAIFA
ncbi:MAG: thioesterase family protein [Hyphomonadaceae bacterium]|nr:thioesterase family protein [Hyphomonadaceae bacterium]